MPRQPDFPEEEQRKEDKRLVAWAFVKRGYGVVNLKDELRADGNLAAVDESRYKSLSGSMARELFRRL